MPSSPIPRRTKRPRPVWAEAIYRRRIELNLTQEEVEARAHDALNQATISKIERGDQDPRNLTATRLGALIEALNWTPLEFSQETGIQLPGFITEATPIPDAIGDRRVPVYDIMTGKLLERVDIPNHWQGNYEGYLVHGNAMPVTAPDNSVVIVRINVQPQPGDVVVAHVKEEDAIVVRHFADVKHFDGINANYYQLASESPESPPIISRDVEFKGIVVEQRRRVINTKRGPIIRGTN